MARRAPIKRLPTVFTWPRTGKRARKAFLSWLRHFIKRAPPLINTTVKVIAPAGGSSTICKVVTPNNVDTTFMKPPAAASLDDIPAVSL